MSRKPEEESPQQTDCCRPRITRCPLREGGSMGDSGASIAFFGHSFSFLFRAACAARSKLSLIHFSQKEKAVKASFQLHYFQSLHLQENLLPLRITFTLGNNIKPAVRTDRTPIRSLHPYQCHIPSIPRLLPPSLTTSRLRCSRWQNLQRPFFGSKVIIILFLFPLKEGFLFVAWLADVA